MKKIILFITMLLSIGLVINAQTVGTVDFNMANENTPSGAFDVPINVTGFDAVTMPNGTGGFELTLIYDDAVLTYTGYTGTYSAPIEYIVNDEGGGVLSIDIYDFTNLTFNVADGKVIDLHFTFTSGYSDLAFVGTNQWYDDAFTFFPFATITNGSVGDYIISGGAWNTATNWNSGVVPLADRDVYVATGTETTVAAAAVANNVTVQVGGELTLNAALTAGGDFLVETDATGSGSVINNGNLTVTGTSSAQCYVTEGQWHGIASPVSGETFAAMYLTGPGMPDVWVKEYDVTTNTYTSVTELTTPMGDMKGFFTWIEALPYGAPTFTFEGTFRTGTMGSTGNMVNNGTNNGHNYVGNPFSSAIDWDAASGWTKTDLNDAIYVYNGTAWATYVGGVGGNGGTQYVAMNQGFFVQATNSVTGTLTMDEDVCVHNPVAYLKSTTVEQSVIRLELSDAGSVDEAVIRFIAGATTDYDGNFDAHKLFSFDENYPQIYSTANDFMAINSLSDTDEKNPIAMDVRGTNGNSMTITLTEANDFDKLYLKDEYTLDITDLKKDSYSFTYDADITDRFTILFGINGIDNPTSDLNAKVFATGNTIQVNMDSFENANISVYNLLGQVVAGSFVNSNITRIPMNKSGYYLVKVSDGENVITQKVFIK